MTWQIAAIVIDVIFGAIIITLEVIAVKRFLQRRKEVALIQVENAQKDSE